MPTRPQIRETAAKNGRYLWGVRGRDEMLNDHEPIAPARKKSVQAKLIVVLWTLAICASMTGWLLALGYIGYLTIRRAGWA